MRKAKDFHAACHEIHLALLSTFAAGGSSVGHNATRDYVRANRVPERAPMMAFAVGLDSVQFQMNKMRHGAEMCLTRRACMGFQEGAVEPVRTCPPTACTELRTGWKASWVCRCNDNASALLNCAG